MAKGEVLSFLLRDNSSRTDPELFGIPETLGSVMDRIGYLGGIGLLLMVYLLWLGIYAFLFSPLSHIPGPWSARLTGKRAMWLIMTGRATAAATSDYERYGDVYMAKPNAVYLCDPEDARHVLQMGDFRKTDMYRMFEYDGLPNVATILNPAEANLRRRQIHPFFNYSFLAKMESLILKHGISAVKTRWDALIAGNAASEKGGTIVNYRIDTQLAMFDIIGALVFGRDFNALQDANMEYTGWVNDSISYMILAYNFPWIKSYPFSMLLRKMKKSYDDLVTFSKQSIDIRKDLLKKGGEKPADLLQALLDSVEPDSKIPMTDEQAQAESIGMLVGGSESTSSVISWVIHFLMLYPEELKKVVAEVRSKFPLHHLITHADARAELPYLEACIYETLRCIPTASTSFPRISDQRGVTIKGLYIPPGTEITTNKCAAHIHEGSWDDPLDFKPSRFIENPDTKKNMLSFAYGTRLCIGKNLAWVVMLVTLAGLFQEYDIELPQNALFNPDHKDEKGRPKLMPTKLGVATMPANPERDCVMIIRKRC